MFFFLFHHYGKRIQTQKGSDLIYLLVTHKININKFFSLLFSGNKKLEIETRIEGFRNMVGFG